MHTVSHLLFNLQYTKTGVIDKAWCNIIEIAVHKYAYAQFNIIHCLIRGPVFYNNIAPIAKGINNHLVVMYSLPDSHGQSCLYTSPPLLLS